MALCICTWVKGLGGGGRFGMPAAAAAAAAAASFFCRLASFISYTTSRMRCVTPCWGGTMTQRCVFSGIAVSVSILPRFVLRADCSTVLQEALQRLHVRLVQWLMHDSMLRNVWTCCHALACARVQHVKLRTAGGVISHRMPPYQFVPCRSAPQGIGQHHQH